MSTASRGSSNGGNSEEVGEWREGRDGSPSRQGSSERGKGDHRHVAGKEEPYAFTTVEKLIDDFKTDVRRMRGGP